MRAINRLRGLGQQQTVEQQINAILTAGGNPPKQGFPTPSGAGQPSTTGCAFGVQMSDYNIGLCSSPVSYYINPFCWTCSPSAWQQAAALNAGLLNAKVTPSADLTPGQLTGAEPIDPSVQAAKGYTAGMQQILSQVQNQPTLTYDCTDLSQLLNDRSNYWANCLKDSPWFWVALLGGGLLLVVVVKEVL